MASTDAQRLPVGEAQGSGIPKRRPHADTPGRDRRLLSRWKDASLLWRVFVANIVLLVAAVAALAWAPVTVHRVATPRELVILAVGLVLVLAVDLVLLRRVLAPLRRLAALMGTVEPDQPGRRAEPPETGGREVVALAEALNSMLDRLEDERRESGRRALVAQEGERARIARELHDEVGQTLTAVALRAEQAAAQPSRQNEALGEIAETVLRSLEDVHRIGRELRPEALDDLGLVNALIVMCSRLARQGGVRIRRELDAQLPPLTEEVELVLYRVAQEALTNALRHSGGGEVKVSLHSSDGRVTLTVADNGTGLPKTRREGGLLGMRERAMLIGADLDISSTARGTRIRLSVPTAPASA
ncbi:MAG TPA: ATP-binding protein [Solirubrobacteraceae bacterium]|nr:ATP-binding protein [Solirubrobacteraceae bacterium]